MAKKSKTKTTELQKLVIKGSNAAAKAIRDMKTPLATTPTLTIKK